MINVLDRGYVRLEEVMGSDLLVVNAARVSFDKRSEALTERDRHLIRYLARHEETSPFRHCVVRLELYAPLFVARQLYKYSVAALHREDQFAWNETSRRYITEEPEFYIPQEWRHAPENSKQGSGGSFDIDNGSRFSRQLAWVVTAGSNAYNYLLKQGVCVEQARLMLPAYAMYVRWKLTISLAAVLHLLKERLDEKAQWETQQYAEAIGQVVLPYFEEAGRAFGYDPTN